MNKTFGHLLYGGGLYLWIVATLGMDPSYSYAVSLFAGALFAIGAYILGRRD